MDVLAKSITGMANSIESLSGGVAYNTSRVGALTGEVQKIRKHIEWSLNRALSDMHKESLAKSSEDSGRMASALEGLYEGMDKFKENLREIVSKMEEMRQVPATEKGPPEPEFGPAIPPTGFSGTPNTPNVGIAASGLLPPPLAPPQPPLAIPTATFVGYCPARAGEAPMSHPINMEVPSMKGTSAKVIDEATGGVRAVSPTRQLHPSTGTAAFAPLGYMCLKGTSDFRRIYALWKRDMPEMEKDLRFSSKNSNLPGWGENSFRARGSLLIGLARQRSAQCDLVRLRV